VKEVPVEIKPYVKKTLALPLAVVCLHKPVKLKLFNIHVCPDSYIAMTEDNASSMGVAAKKRHTLLS